MTEDTPQKVMNGAKSSTIDSALAKLKEKEPEELQLDSGKKPADYWTNLATKHRDGLASGPQYTL